MAVELDVGGIVYKTTRTTLTSFEDSFFSRLFDGNWKEQEDKNGRIFIDRDGHTFRYVLEFLRNRDKTILPKDEMLLEQIKLEAEFFSLPQLTQLIDYHINITLKEVELVFISIKSEFPPNIPEKHKLNMVYRDTVVLTLAQMLSVPDSFFFHLANNIINRTPGKLSREVDLGTDGRYYVRISRPHYAKQVADMVKMGESNFDVYTACGFRKVNQNHLRQKQQEFFETAQQLCVPYAVEHGLRMLQKTQSKLDKTNKM